MHFESEITIINLNRVPSGDLQPLYLSHMWPEALMPILVVGLLLRVGLNGNVISALQKCTYFLKKFKENKLQNMTLLIHYKKLQK